MPGIPSGERETGNDSCNMKTEQWQNYSYWLNKQLYEAQKKSGSNKGNAANYLAFIVRIVHVCVEKQSAVKPSDAIGKKEEEPALFLKEYPMLPTLPTSQPPKIYFHISSLFQFIFAYFIFENLISHIFLIIIMIIRCSGMFRNAPECSRMFHVPGFIDGLFNQLMMRLKEDKKKAWAWY